MKKILFVAAAATLLAAGCQKTEIINSVNPNGTPAMTFSTEIAKLTKSATATGTVNLQDQGFVLSAVCAYEDKHTTDKEFNSYYEDFENIEFTYDEEWTISGGNSYFWPGKNRNLVFFAVSSSQRDNDNKHLVKVPTTSPEAVDGFRVTGEQDGDGCCSEPTVNEFVIKNYTVTPPTYGEDGTQTGSDDDLMVADVVVRNQDDQVNGQSGKGVVDLFFNHTLSKVEFVFSTNPTTANLYQVIVNSITVKDVVTQADLTIGVKFIDKTSANEYDWDTASEELYVSAPVDGKKTDYVVNYALTLTGAEKSYATWLVIPQSLTSKEVSINYTIQDISKEGTTPQEFTSVWPLAAENIVSAWETNKYVKYKVNLSPNLITFNPVVEKEWETAVDIDPSTGEAPVTPTPVTPDYNSIDATLGNVPVILYYEGELAIGTVVYTKNEQNEYVPAGAGTYTLIDGTLVVDENGKVTERTTAGN